MKRFILSELDNMRAINNRAIALIRSFINKFSRRSTAILSTISLPLFNSTYIEQMITSLSVFAFDFICVDHNVCPHCYNGIMTLLGDKLSQPLYVKYSPVG